MPKIEQRLAKLEQQRRGGLAIVDVCDLSELEASAALAQAHKVAATVLVVKYVEENHEAT